MQEGTAWLSVCTVVWHGAFDFHFENGMRMPMPACYCIVFGAGRFSLLLLLLHLAHRAGRWKSEFVSCVSVACCHVEEEILECLSCVLLGVRRHQAQKKTFSTLH